MDERLQELAVPQGPFRSLDLIEQPGARRRVLTIRIAPVASWCTCCQRIAM
jgi:hypothetical protein